MLMRHAIGAALRRIRQDSGLTLREVAAIAAVSMPYLSEVERGRKEPSSEVIAGICTALGLTLVDLLDEARVELFAGTPIVDLAVRRGTSEAHELDVRGAGMAGGRVRGGAVDLAA